MKKKIKDLGIDYRGVRVQHYIDRYNKIKRSEDNELFKRISSNKGSLKKQRQSHESYKRSLRDTALFKRSLMNMNPIYSNTSSKENKEFVKSLMNMNPIYSDPSKLNKEFIESFMNIDTGYTSSKTEERRRYEENVQDKSEYQSEMKRMMTAVNKHESFEIDINDNSEKQYAFTQVLRNIRKMKSSEWKPLVYGYDMN